MQLKLPSVADTKEERKQVNSGRKLFKTYSSAQPGGKPGPLHQSAL